MLQFIQKLQVYYDKSLHFFCISFIYFVFLFFLAEEDDEPKEDAAAAEASGDSDENLAKIAANVRQVILIAIYIYQHFLFLS